MSTYFYPNFVKIIRLSLLPLLLLLTNISKAQLQAAFKADTTTGCGTAIVNFTNQSTGSSLTYKWDFGNGSGSTLKNPTATYTQSGAYDVQLIVKNSGGNDTLTKVNYINVFAKPAASFTFSPIVGCLPLLVSFQSTSTTASSGFKSYKWDFSDGSPAGSGKNTSHNYLSSGTYTPSLEVVDNNGCSDVTSKSTVTVFPKAEAKFTTSNPRINCTSPYTVGFVDQSLGKSLSYEWDFGDGQTSTQASPSHTYSSLGRYDVKLIVVSANCSDTISKAEYVILEQSEANFELKNDTICMGELFEPLNKSKGARLYAWKFDDGKISTLENPKHIYQDSGYFEISLTVSAGASCTNKFIDTIYVQQLVADFATAPHFSCNQGSEFKLYGKSNFPANYEWITPNFRNLIIPGNPIPRFYNDSLGYADTINIKTGVDTTNKLYAFPDTLIAMTKYGCRDTVVHDSSRTVHATIARFLVNGVDYPVKEDPIGFCIPDTFELKDVSHSHFPITKWEWGIFGKKTTQNPPPDGIVDFDILDSVKLTITDSNGCTSFFKHFFIGGHNQNPSFTFYPNNLCQGDTLFIVNTSTVDSLIDNYHFSLLPQDTVNKGVSSKLNSTDSVTIFTEFESVGKHLVQIRAFSNGCDTSFISTKPLYINGPKCSFTTSVDSCQNRKRVNFYSQIEGATRFHWDFGDGSPLDWVNENPIHVYPNNMVYRAILTTYNDTNRCGPYRDTSDLNLGVYPPLTISPPRREYCLGESVKLFIADSSLYFRMDWKLNGKKITNRAFYNMHFKERGTYVFEVEAEEALGCIHNTATTFYVSRPKAKIAYDVLNGCLPSSIRFVDSSKTDTTLAKWEWRFGNGKTSNKAIDTTKYTTQGYKDIFLRVENIFGCADSVFSPNHLQSTDFTVDFTAFPRNICTGDSVSFRNLSSLNGSAFLWRFGDDDSLKTMDQFIGHRYDSSGTFSVQLYGISNDNCEITQIKNTYINVEQTPIADFAADTLMANCYPFDVNFIDQSAGPIIDWTWYFGDDNTSKIQNPYHNYVGNGYFDISLVVKTNFGCSDSIYKKAFIQINAPNADIAIDEDSVCIHEDIQFQLNNPTNFTNFYWDFGDGSGSSKTTATHAFQKTGIRYISLILTDSNTNCTVSILDSIYIFESQADFIVNQDTACDPFNAKFTNQSIGADNFKWNFGDGSTGQDFHPNHLYNSAGVYTAMLTIESNIGCKDTATKTILVNPSPKLAVTPDQKICFGDSVLLTASGGKTYLWSPDSSLNDNSSQQWAKADTTTTYTVVAFNEFNCTDTSQITVFIQQPPIPHKKGAQDTSIIIGEYVDLDVYAGPGFTYEWLPTRGLSCSTCAKTRAQPLKNTQYIIKIADSLGCFLVYDTIYIEVIEKYSLEVPTAFTPNSDGNNDIIYAKGWGLKELVSFKIYNRFGEMIFETNDFNQGWDGFYKGRLQPIETYVYVVKGLTYRDKVITKKGNINLLR